MVISYQKWCAALTRAVLWAIAPLMRTLQRDNLDCSSSDDELVTKTAAKGSAGFSLPPEEAPEAGRPQHWLGSEQATVAVGGRLDPLVLWEDSSAPMPEEMATRPSLALHFDEGCNPCRVHVVSRSWGGRVEDRILPVEETDRGEVAVAEDRVTFEFNKLLICKCGSTCEWRPQEREIRINLRVEAVGDSWVEYVWLTHGILGDKSGWRAALIDQDLVKLEKPGEPRQDVDEWTEWEEQGR